MTANNYEGLRELREITEKLMDANAHIHEVLNSTCGADELRAEHEKLNLLQVVIREKLSTYTIYINQAVKAADELEGKEDLIALKLFDIISSCGSDAKGAQEHVTQATLAHESWTSKHLASLKDMFRRERVVA